MLNIQKIKPALGFTHLVDADLVSRLNAIRDAMTGNAAFPNPPVDPAAFKAAIDAYAAAVGLALDGSKQAIADRHKKRQVVTEMLVLLGHYVQATCKNDLQTLLSSGFVAASTTRTPPQPLSQPSIARVDQGNSGQFLVWIKAVPKARNYELRYATLSTGGATGPGPWSTIPIVTVRAPISVSNLAPGTTYVFQVRAFGHLGFTDWSDSVNRMCI